MLAVLFWALWYNRNKFIHEGSQQSAYKIVGFVQAYIAESRLLNNISSYIPKNRETHRDPPLMGRFKVNIDTTFQ